MQGLASSSLAHSSSLSALQGRGLPGKSTSQSESTGRLQIKPATKNFKLELPNDPTARFCQVGGGIIPKKEKAVLEIDTSYSTPKVVPKIPINIEAALRIERNCHAVIDQYEALKRTVKDPSEVDIVGMKKELTHELNPFRNSNFSAAGRKLSHTLSAKQDHNDLLAPQSSKKDKKQVASELTPSKSYIPMEARYLTVSDWKFESKDENVKDAYMKIAQSIILREGMLVKMQSILGNLDSQYWKYAVLRNNFLQKGKSLHSESLISKKIYVKQLQNEVSVGFAHLRGITVDILEQIYVFRKLLYKKVATRELISIFWNNENYLLKMLKDCNFINDFLVIRMWLGFEAGDPLLLPPDIHNPSKIFKKRRELFDKWNEAYLSMHSLKRKSKKKVSRKSEINEDFINEVPLARNMMIVGESDSNFSSSSSPVDVSAAFSTSFKIETTQLAGTGLVSSSSASGDGADNNLEAKLSIDDSNKDDRSNNYENNNENNNEINNEVIEGKTELQSEFASCESDKIKEGESDNITEPAVTIESSKINDSLIDVNDSEVKDEQEEIKKSENVNTNCIASNIEGDAQIIASDKLINLDEIPSESTTNKNLNVEIVNIDDCKLGEKSELNKENPQNREGNELNEDRSSAITPADNSAEEESNDRRLSSAPASNRQSNSARKHDTMNYNDDDDNRSRGSVGSFTSSNQDTIDSLFTANGEQWRELRDKCALSWGQVDGKWTQNEIAAPQFWSDHRFKTPYIVEAAVGFEEVFPDIYLIPPITSNIARRCLSLARLFGLEINRMAELVGKTEQSRNFQEKLHQKVFESQLEEVKNSIYSQENFNQHYILRYRQEGNKGILDKPLYEKLQSNGSDDFIDALGTSSLVDNGNNYLEETGGGTFALTSTNQAYEMRSSIRRFLKLDKAKFEDRLREKIDGHRDFTSIDEKEGVRVMKNDVKALKAAVAQMQSADSLHCMSENLARIMQKYVRRFIACARVKRLRKLKLFNTCAIKLHKVARGFLGRRKFKRIKRNHKILSLINRKTIIRKFRAAVTISRFIRFCANKCIVARDGNQYNVHDNYGASVLSRERFNSILTESNTANLKCLDILVVKSGKPKPKSLAQKKEKLSLVDKSLLVPLTAEQFYLPDVPVSNKHKSESSITSEEALHQPKVRVDDMKSVLKNYFSS